MAALCRAHGFTAASKKDGPWEQMAETRSGKANFIVALRLELFPPGTAETRELG